MMPYKCFCSCFIRIIFVFFRIVFSVFFYILSIVPSFGIILFFSIFSIFHLDSPTRLIIYPFNLTIFRGIITSLNCRLSIYSTSLFSLSNQNILLPQQASKILCNCLVPPFYRSIVQSFIMKQFPMPPIFIMSSTTNHRFPPICCIVPS